jgi:hypothetical protein
MKLIEKLRDCPDEQGWTNPITVEPKTRKK